MSSITPKDLAQMGQVKWFRCLSAGQIHVCNMLLTTLRDDLEQHTIYRTLEFLEKFGLSDLPDCHRIRKLMDMSKGSDLAFLYFLWEADYKMNCDNYTNNEQLILSGIAHLDMTSTLRELDRILPPSTHSKKAVLHKQQLDVVVAKKAKRCRHVCFKSPPKYNSLNPYYQKQPKPQVKPINYVSVRKPNKVIFPEYENYNNPYYKIPNEKNRWFAAYDLQPHNRIVKKLLKTEVDRILFERIEMKLTEEEENAMCLRHRSFKNSVNQQLVKLKFSTMQRCMDILDIKGSAAKKRKERLVKQLEQQINIHANKLSEYSKRQYAEVRSIKREDSECKFCLNIASLPPKKSKANLKILMGYDFNEIANEVDAKQNQIKVQTMVGNIDRFDVGNAVLEDIKSDEITTTSKDKNKNKKSNNKNKLIMSGESSQRLLGGETKQCILRTLPTGPTAEAPPISTDQEETFFKGNTLYRPFSFDYEKIFNIDYVSDSPSISELDSDENVAKTVHHYCINALKYIYNDLDKELDTNAAGDAGSDYNENAQTFDSLLNQVNQLPLKQRNPADELNQAIQICCSKMLNGSMDQQRLSDQSYALQSLEQPCEEVQGMSVFFKMPYLDPDDNELMEKLLRMALLMIAKNRKFVLATFPNAHNLPILKEWIAERYQKRYSGIDGEKMIKHARAVYEALQQKNMRLAIPDPVEQRYKKVRVSYAYHNEILKTADNIRSSYYRHLNSSELEDTHLIWLAMRGYSVTQRKSHQPFFAYMPPRAKDILRHNVWHPRNFRNMVYMRSSIKSNT